LISRKNPGTKVRATSLRLLFLSIAALLAFALTEPGCHQAYDPSSPGGMPPEHPIPGRNLVFKQVKAPDIRKQTDQEIAAKSNGCLASNCHAGIDAPNKHDGIPRDTRDMHNGQERIGCTDCHGGDAQTADKEKAHVKPLYAEDWPRTGQMPVRSYSMLNNESPEFVRFVNPSDLRIDGQTCGRIGCHVDETAKVPKSMMATAPMLWEAALYNNGVYQEKIARFGESYSRDGNPTRVETVPPPTEEETREHDVLPYLDPLPSFEITQPGNVLRVFERGEDRLSVRGFGTKVRTDPVFQGLQRTRLFDPTLWFLGTNDHPGDFRSSGCAGCHVIYANDRDKAHSSQYSSFGNMGMSASNDQSIRKDVSGFPIKHQFTMSIPSSQCVVCHVHPGTTVTNSYFGTIWWDNESDGRSFYPEKAKHPSANEEAVDLMANPEATNVKGLWSDPKFLEDSGDPSPKDNFNSKLKHVQLADFHGHGWLFRYVWKMDTYGNLLDSEGRKVADNSPYRWRKAVKLQDIHSEYGMQCADCHFEGDSHGNGKLYGEVRNAIEIRCEDCHGTYTRFTTLLATGNARVDYKYATGPANGELKVDSGSQVNFRSNRVASGARFMESRSHGQIGLKEFSSMDPADTKPRDRGSWPVPQLALYDNPKAFGWKSGWEQAAYAHTIQKDNKTWGDVNVSDDELAHPLNKMSCQTCHSSWVPSCFGCHLPMKANMRRPILHYNGDMTRNWTSYNYQTLRNDVFMIAKDGAATGNRISPARSSCAVEVSSYNANREVIYTQQQTVSAEGFSGQAFSTTAPHTVRSKETKQCSDCHLSSDNKNNAKMAQLLMQGTNFVNFIGRYCWVAEGHEGMEAVTVTERDEPQAVIGSHLHELAYPDEFKRFVSGGRVLRDSFEHGSTLKIGWNGALPEFHNQCLSIQNRGEYLFTAQGKGGFVVYDIANLDNKGFSERFTSAPVSPLGQRTYVSTRYATNVLLPTTMLLDPRRSHRPENLEQKVPLEAEYAYVTDKFEGLVPVDVITLGNGNPDDNFFHRSAGFNPGGVLDGAIGGTIAGNYAYVLCDRGLVIVDVSNPDHMQVVSEVDAPHLVKPRAIAVQFRYAFVVDSSGLKIINITDPRNPQPVDRAALPVADARNIYVARTYAYISAGAEGLIIADVENPEHPTRAETYNADGKINDLNDTKLAMTDASVFAYLADGKNGLRVLQLISPDDTPGYLGFSPRPTPQLIATFATKGPALAIPKGLDRDRAVDESGNQLAVFGRRGARPLFLSEARALYLREDGSIYTVTDKPMTPAKH
jgi:hypothetical protein